MTKHPIRGFMHVFVIGNGFDVACGLPTRYSDFLGSQQFKSLEADNNEIAKHLRIKYELQNWIDVEQEFPALSNKNMSRTGDFHLEYKSLCAAFIEYINDIDYSLLNKELEVISTIRSLAEEGPVGIINFNYTRTVEELFGEKYDQLTVIHVHGTAEKNDIVFGVHDRATIRPEHVFLRKAYSDALYTDDTVGEIMKTARESVSIFGHSLGETDTNQFNPFFGVGQNTDESNLNIYYHSEQSRLDLFQQLERLSSNGLQKIRTQHNVKLIGPQQVL